MEEKIEISILLNLYGNLLTQTQKKYMDLYYNQDYSLSEIGDLEKVTRQAVNRILLKSKNKLFEYEKKLKFMKKEEQIKKILDEFKSKQIEKETEKIIKKIYNKLDF